MAERLGVTVQAVSDYLKRVANEGLVETVGGVWRPTKTGTAFLHESMRELQRFVSESMGKLRIIDETYALAERRVRAEDEVGLGMRDGRLWAGPTRGRESRGRARTSAEKGQLVLVGHLEGLLDLHPAPVTILSHPDFPVGPPLDRARRHVRRLLRSHAGTLVAVQGVASVAWAQALGLQVDLEFSPVASAYEASQRGVPVLYLAPTHEASAVVTELREASGGRSDALPLRSVTL